MQGWRLAVGSGRWEDFEWEACSGSEPSTLNFLRSFLGFSLASRFAGGMNPALHGIYFGISWAFRFAGGLEGRGPGERQRSFPFEERLYPYGKRLNPVGERLCPVGKRLYPYGKGLNPVGKSLYPYG